MFTGIIEATGKVESIRSEGTNLLIRLSCPFTAVLKPDQSLAHNGVCLTVTETDTAFYSVTLIKETLERSNLGSLKAGDIVNLERCMQVGDRLDGHIVQGHVDQTGIIEKIENAEGSYKFSISYDQKSGHLTVPKGSITVNGVSLTVVDSNPGIFSVAIIPYTWEHTTFHQLKAGDSVNLEFDIIGKYIIAKMNQQR
jgi:riboflavin synthase